MSQKPESIWKPLYTISPTIAQGLMAIEASKAVVENTPLSPAVEAELRYKARVRSTHYSTRIEGNRLTLKEAQDAVNQVRKGQESIELSPQSAYIRRLQHLIAERSDLPSRSLGRDPDRRVVIYRERESQF